MDAATRNLLDTYLQPGRERRAAEYARQTAGPCDNPWHEHDEPAPARIAFCGYWLCPLDEVLTPNGRAGGQSWRPVGELTTSQRAKIERKSGLRRRR